MPVEPASGPSPQEGGRSSRLEKARLAAEILAIYARVRWLLRRRGLAPTVAALRGGARPAAGPGRDRAAALRCAHAVVRVLRVLPADSRCLVRSLVLLALLARRGIRAELVIGVLAEPEFAAHAWLEQAGVPLLKPGRAGDGRLVEL